jgi:hypothetical protein
VPPRTAVGLAQHGALCAWHDTYWGQDQPGAGQAGGSMAWAGTSTSCESGGWWDPKGALNGHSRHSPSCRSVPHPTGGA